MISGLERFPGEGNGTPLQYSCLGNPMDRGAWQAIVHGVAKCRHTYTHTLNIIGRTDAETEAPILCPSDAKS